MQVENWPIGNVKPYVNNPRKNDDAVEYVANSIREFGFQQPLVVDSEGVLIVGHTRLKAAQKLGLIEVPVVVADGLTDEQVKAYRLADNKTGEKSWWDYGKLELELGDIDLLGMNMEHFGFGDAITSVLDTLENEEIIASEASEASEFAMTLVLPIQHREAVEQYIKDNGKQQFVKLVLDEVGA